MGQPRWNILGKELQKNISRERLFKISDAFMSEIIYYCANRKCGKEVTPEDLESLPGVKCPHCGGRILYKARPKIVRPVKAV